MTTHNEQAHCYHSSTVDLGSTICEGERDGRPMSLRHRHKVEHITKRSAKPDICLLIEQTPKYIKFLKIYNLY